MILKRNWLTLADPCHENPCLNGGTCSVGEDSQEQCVCAPGYNGDHCENGNN